MSEHKTAEQLRNITKASDAALERAVTAVLQVAEAAAREGNWECYVKSYLLGGADEELVCRRLFDLGYRADPWTDDRNLGEPESGILVTWGDPA